MNHSSARDNLYSLIISFVLKKSRYIYTMCNLLMYWGCTVSPWKLQIQKSSFQFLHCDEYRNHTYSTLSKVTDWLIVAYSPSFSTIILYFTASAYKRHGDFFSSLVFPLGSDPPGWAGSWPVSPALCGRTARGHGPAKNEISSVFSLCRSCNLASFSHW